MAVAQWFSGKASGSSAPNTLYCTLPSGHVGPSTTESVVQSPSRTAGVYSKLYIRVTANDRTATSTATFRTGGADGSQSISIGAGLTGDFMDSSNTDTVAGTGELLDVKLIVGTGGTSFTWALLGILFTPTTGQIVKYQATGAGTTVGPGTTQYQSIAGLGSTQTTEASEQHKVRLTGTLRNLYAVVTTNSLNTATTTIRTRKNGGNGGQSLSIGAGLTGVFEDTSGSDSVVAGDLINYQTAVGSGGTGTFSYGNIGCELFVSAGGLYQLMCATNNGVSVSQNSTLYMPPAGPLSTSGTEANVKGRINNPGCIVSKLQAYVVSNTIAASTTIRSRKNEANGAQSITIGSTLTGFFEDASNTDSLATNDYLAYQIVSGASGANTIRINNIGVLVAPLSTITPSGIASGLAIGSGDKLNPTILPSSRTSSLAFGTDKLNPIIYPAARTSTLSLGQPGLASADKIAPSGIASTVVVSTGAQLNPKILMTGLASTLAFGTAKLNPLIIASSIASGLVVSTGDKLNFIIYPTSKTSELVVSSSASIFASGVIAPSGIASGLVVSSGLKLNPIIYPASKTSGLVIGQPILLAILAPSSIASGAVVSSGAQLNLIIYMVGIASGLSFGNTVVISADSQLIVVPAIVSTTVVGGHYIIGLLDCITDWTVEPVIGPSEFQKPKPIVMPESGISGWD